MPTVRGRKPQARNARASFTWGVQVSEIGWMKPAGAIEGSSASDCIAIAPADKRRRRKPASTGAA